MLLPELASFAPSVVIAGRRVVARDGAAVLPEPANANLPFRDTVKIDTLSADDFRWRMDVPACPIPPQPVQFTPTQEGQEGSGRLRRR